MHGRKLPSLPRLRPFSRRWVLRCLFAAAVLSAGSGCSRKFFRKRADKEVEAILTQKNQFPDWEIRNWNVYPDPRARYADPSNPDRPPYPPDDYAARKLSPNPQWPGHFPGHRSGTGRFDGDTYQHMLSQWDAENRALYPPEKKDDAKKDADDPAREKLPPPKGVAPDEKPTQKVRLADPSWTAAKPPGPRVTEHREPAYVVEPVVPAGGTTQDAAKKPLDEPRKLPDADKKTPEQADRPGIPKDVPKDKDRDIDYSANPNAPDAYGDFLKALTTDQRGYKITMQQAVELGLINSREFQDRREDLYIAALPSPSSGSASRPRRSSPSRSSANRPAGCAPKAAASGGGSARTPGSAGCSRPGRSCSLASPTSSSSTSPATSRTPGCRTRRSAWPSRSSAAAGTPSPWSRSPNRSGTWCTPSAPYARFRKLYYVSITAGGNTANITNNPYSLQGLSVNLGRGIGGNLTAPSIGYMPLLLRSAVIANQRKNITALEDLLRLYQAFREGGQQSDLQVGQVEQNLLGSRSQLLGGTGGGQGGAGVRGFLEAVDNFKLQLGLPVTVGLDFHDAPLRPIRQQLSRFEEVYAQVLEIEKESRRFDPNLPVGQLRERWSRLLSDSALTRGTAFAKNLAARWDAWRKLTDDQVEARLRAAAAERRRLLDERAARPGEGAGRAAGRQRPPGRAERGPRPGPAREVAAELPRPGRG